jgi:hypothetical protein
VTEELRLPAGRSDDVVDLARRCAPRPLHIWPPRPVTYFANAPPPPRRASGSHGGEHSSGPGRRCSVINAAMMCAATTAPAPEEFHGRRCGGDGRSGPVHAASPCR